jgi:hypothetical protein
MAPDPDGLEDITSKAEQFTFDFFSSLLQLLIF